MKNTNKPEKLIKFSVVIPLYNKEKHIKRALNSVLKQSYNNFEIIIVNDGSTDNSLNEVKKINDSRIRLITQDNSGVSVARNKGIEFARYEYIGFIDADDSWDRNFLKTIKQLVLKYPNAGAYGTGYKFIKHEEEIIPKSISNFEENWEGLLDDYFKYAVVSPIITASSVVIPKKVFKEVGVFMEHINRGEDLEMWCRIALKYKIAFNSNIHAFYCIDSDNRACQIKPIIEKTFSYYAEDILRENMKELNATVYFDKYMNQRIINKALLYANSNNKEEAKRILKEYKFNKYSWKKYIKTVIGLLFHSFLDI